MKSVWLYSLRLYLKLGLFFYFKRFKVVGIENIPKKQSVLVLGNHQSALIDPLLLAVTFKQYAYYLTRAGVFQKKLVKAFLGSVNMLPVYRVRDGWSKITNNNPIFEKCITLLKQKKTIVIFPEGSHNLKRTVRPLSKGFTRIVLNAIEENKDTEVLLLPVGFNYENAVDFPDSVSVYFGKAIPAKDLLSETVHESVNNIKTRVFDELTQLTTHIAPGVYQETTGHLEQLNVDFLDPIKVNACIDGDFQNCPVSRRKNFIEYLLKPLVYLNLCAPILFWRLVVEPKIKEPEFVATFRFAVAIVLVPLWLFFIAFILSIFLGNTVAMGYMSFSILTMLAFVKA